MQLHLSMEECKDRESMQSSTKADPGHHMAKSQNTIKHLTQESQEVVQTNLYFQDNTFSKKVSNSVHF